MELREWEFVHREEQRDREYTCEKITVMPSKQKILSVVLYIGKGKREEENLKLTAVTLFTFTMALTHK